MSDFRRAALALLCLLAVALAASLFPASGLGPHPGGGVPSSGGAAPADAPLSPTTPPPGDDAEPPGGTAAPDGDGDATPTSTPTPTPTPTPTRTDAGGTGGPSTGRGPGDALAGLFALAGVGVALLGLLAALGRAGERADPDLPDLGVLGEVLPAPVALGLARLSRGTTSLLLGASTAVPRALSMLAATGRGAGDVLDALARPVGRAAAAVPRALSAAGAGLAAATGGLLGSLPALFGRVGANVDRPGLPSLSRDDGERGGAGDAEDAADDGAPTPRGVVEAWAMLRALVRPHLPRGDHRARTPREVARAAVAAGLPAGPVRRLTLAFERVRYGDAPETEALTARAVETLRTLRGAAAGDDAGGGEA